MGASDHVSYVPEPEDTHILKIVLELYRKVKQWPDALRTAMRLNNVDTVKELFTQCDEP